LPFSEKKGKIMKSFISLVIVVLAVSLTMMFTACEKKGPAEKAGEKIDQAVDKTTDTVKDAKKKVEEGMNK
jgi:predicted small lipoprotein YifL